MGRCGQLDIVLARDVSSVRGWLPSSQSYQTACALRTRPGTTYKLDGGVTLAVPALFFLLMTFAAWASVLSVGLPTLPTNPSYDDKYCPATSVRGTTNAAGDALCYKPFFSDPKTAATWAHDALSRAGSGYVLVLLAAICTSVIVAVWGLFFSVKDELVSPGAGADAVSRGRWLDEGLTFLRWAGRVMYSAMFLFPVGLALAWNPGYAQVTASLNAALGLLVAGGALSLLAFGGRLSKLALGFRPAVRVALDVGNWLREHPRESNPTARICARYVSLLRHISQWRDPFGRGYSAVLIFAHSQGTVITADLLRFLKAEARQAGSFQKYDTALAGFDRLPIVLLTMGCPLRQL